MILNKWLFLFLTIFRYSEAIRQNQMESFIIGGSYTKIHAHPHLVYLDVDCDYVWTCGGSILNQRIILTAAHCLFPCNLNLNHRIFVYAGHEKVKLMPVSRRVKKVIIHKNFNEDTVENDIGLAFLSLSLKFGKNIKRVIINRAFPKGIIVAEFAGWGLIDEHTEELPRQLKYMQQKLRSKRTCSKLKGLHPGMFCAGSTNSGDDRPARGDSGGPLIIENSWEIGILSWNSRRLQALSIYTNISYYYSWIAKHSRTLFCHT